MNGELTELAVKQLLLDDLAYSAIQRENINIKIAFEVIKAEIREGAKTEAEIAAKIRQTFKTTGQESLIIAKKIAETYLKDTATLAGTGELINVPQTQTAMDTLYNGQQYKMNMEIDSYFKGYGTTLLAVADIASGLAEQLTFSGFNDAIENTVNAPVNNKRVVQEIRTMDPCLYCITMNTTVGFNAANFPKYGWHKRCRCIRVTRMGVGLADAGYYGGITEGEAEMLLDVYTAARNARYNASNAALYKGTKAEAAELYTSWSEQSRVNAVKRLEEYRRQGGASQLLGNGSFLNEAVFSPEAFNVKDLQKRLGIKVEERNTLKIKAVEAQVGNRLKRYDREIAELEKGYKTIKDPLKIDILERELDNLIAKRKRAIEESAVRLAKYNR